MYSIKLRPKLTSLTIIRLLDVTAVIVIVAAGISSVTAGFRLAAAGRRSAGSVTAAGFAGATRRLARCRGSAASVVFLVFRFVVFSLLICDIAV